MGSIEHYILHYTVIFYNPGGYYNSFPLHALELPPRASNFSWVQNHGPTPCKANVLTSNVP